MYYRHFKGGFYRKIATARDCDNPDTVYVIYKALQQTNYPKGELWLREQECFNGMRGEYKRMRKLTLKETILLLIGLRAMIKPTLPN